MVVGGFPRGEFPMPLYRTCFALPHFWSARTLPICGVRLYGLNSIREAVVVNKFIVVSLRSLLDQTKCEMC